MANGNRNLCGLSGKQHDGSSKKNNEHRISVWARHGLSDISLEDLGARTPTS